MKIKHHNAHLGATFQYITDADMTFPNQVAPEFVRVARACYKALEADGYQGCKVQTQVREWSRLAKDATRSLGGKQTVRGKAYRSEAAKAFRNVRRLYR